MNFASHPKYPTKPLQNGSRSQAQRCYRREQALLEEQLDDVAGMTTPQVHTVKQDQTGIEG